MALQVIKRELNPIRIMKPFTLVFWRLPLQIVKQEVLELRFEAIVFLYFMKAYSCLLCKLAPLLQRMNPRAFRQLHFRISFYFYEKIVPPPAGLLHTRLSLYRKM